MQDIKCKNCNRLLGKATIMVAAIKCPRCKTIFEYHVYTNTLHVTNQFDTSRKNATIQSESEIRDQRS
jgi:phage FluMu protein Com